MTQRHWRVWALAVSVALVVALVGWGLALRDSADAGPATAGGSAGTLLQAEQEAEAAARDAAISLTTYDYRSLQTAFDWAVTGGTRAFRDRYAEVSEATRSYVAEFKVKAVGSVDSAAATAENPDRVKVLLFIDQELTSDASADRQLATPRVSMTMVRVDGRWLVDDVEIRDFVSS